MWTRLHAAQRTQHSSCCTPSLVRVVLAQVALAALGQVDRQRLPGCAGCALHVGGEPLVPGNALKGAPQAVVGDQLGPQLGQVLGVPYPACRQPAGQVLAK